METQAAAPTSGKIAAIKVKSGDSVQSGQVLVEFD
jgi:biotin carboxyl carrier protein